MEEPIISAEEESLKSSAELARHFAEEGLPEYVVDYLQIAELKEYEKKEVLATAYEKRAEIKRKIAEDFKSTSLEHRYIEDIEADLKKAAELRKEAEELRKEKE